MARPGAELRSRTVNYRQPSSHYLEGARVRSYHDRIVLGPALVPGKRRRNAVREAGLRAERPKTWLLAFSPMETGKWASSRICCRWLWRAAGCGRCGKHRLASDRERPLIHSWPPLTSIRRFRCNNARSRAPDLRSGNLRLHARPRRSGSEEMARCPGFPGPVDTRTPHDAA